MRTLRLDPERPTGIVMFGGHGSRVMRGIAKRLDDVQLILVCGHNAVLAEQLRAMRASAPRVVLGFHHEDRLLHGSSAIFSSANPARAASARRYNRVCPSSWCATRGPCRRSATTRSGWRENGVGVVLDSFKAIRSGVARVTEHADLYRAGVKRIRNRAVFEIPEILEQIPPAPKVGHPGCRSRATRT